MLLLVPLRGFAIAYALLVSGAPMPDTTSSTDAAEGRLRAYLTAKSIAASDVRRLTFTKADAFALTRDDGRAVNAVVVGDHVWVDPKPDLDVVGAILKASDFLEQRQLGADDLIFLVTSFGTVPKDIAGFGSYRQTKQVPGYAPKLEFGSDGAHLDLVIPRNAGRRGTTVEPTAPVYKARLSISPRYQVRWHVDKGEVPLPDIP